MYKDPITDSGKRSKKGQMTLEIKDGGFQTITEGQGDPKNVRRKISNASLSS